MKKQKKIPLVKIVPNYHCKPDEITIDEHLAYEAHMALDDLSDSDREAMREIGMESTRPNR